ncbi:MAG: hypothetical protein M3R15_24730 [Acidobacteriota bacterium]|nr:hypothetical protein [Acidobacteriota bacterium]
MTDDSQPILEVEKQSFRGRACPNCGGKIIPSDRAIYQSAANPSELFPLWQCERCGHEEMSVKRAAPKPVHQTKKS